MIARDYQLEIFKKASESDVNQLVQLDTGAGKTLIIKMLCEHYKQSRIAVVAHTRLLIKQLKASLSSSVEIMTPHTANIRKPDLSDALLIIDEAHHCTEENIWGKMAANSRRCIGFTATPWRLDGQPLDAHFKQLVQAESLRDDSVHKLIGRGVLSDFVAFTLPYDASNLKLGRHDYTTASLIKDANTQFNTIASDVIKEYKRRANGKQAVYFCVTIELAKKQAQIFNEAGIPAAAVSSKHSSADNDYKIEQFKDKTIQVLCHVDMFGEGIDIPGIECIGMTRKTASLSLYRQWVGRALRIADNKQKAIIIDHVGNVAEHGLPDRHINWSLSNYESKPQQVKECKYCGAAHSLYAQICKNCGSQILGRGSFKIIKQIGVDSYQLEQMVIERARAEERREQKKIQYETKIIYRSLLGAPPLVEVISKKVIPDVVQIWLDSGKNISDINDLLQNATQANVWAAAFKGFNYQKADKFYEQHSKR